MYCLYYYITLHYIAFAVRTVRYITFLFPLHSIPAPQAHALQISRIELRAYSTKVLIVKVVDKSGKSASVD